MKKVFLFIYLCFLSLAAIAGNGWVSSGGDNTPGNIGAAWFLGDEKVDYCIALSNNFSVPKSILKKRISESVLIWKKYYEDNVDKFINKTNHPNFNFNYNDSCVGSIDIKFLFGIETDEIQRLKKQFFNPFGFSTLKSYDPLTGRGNGVIWFADPAIAYPDSDPFGLNGMIIHELGHVFGNGHVPLTIMDEKIADSILSSGPLAGWPLGDPSIRDFFSHIDGQNKLFFHYAELWSFEGHVPFDYLNPSIWAKQLSLMNRLFNRNTRGSILAKFYNDGPWVNYKLRLQDDLGSIEISIPGSTDGSGIEKKAELFKTFFQNKNETTPIVSFESTKSWTFYTTLKTPQNENLGLSINLFTDDYSPVQLRIFYKDSFISIFKLGRPTPQASRR
jgi:hypothetical protein